MLTCKICTGEFEKLAKAHVIPRSFFKKMRADGSKYSVVFEARQEGISRVPKQAGIYDREIICTECERIFGRYDDHGFEVLSKERGERDAYYDPEGNLCGVYLRGANYRLLKLFILSVLWRAHASSLEFFAKVDLGPHADVILQAIKTGKELAADTYSTSIILPVGEAFPGSILRPARTKINGVHFCQLYLPNIKILVKMDKRPTPPLIDLLQLKPGQEIVAPLLPYKGSTEDKFFRQLYSFMKEHSLFRNEGERN